MTCSIKAMHTCAVVLHILLYHMNSAVHNFAYIIAACFAHALHALQVADLLQDNNQCSTDYVEYKACGHVPMDERPQEVLRDLQRFATQVSRNPQPTPDADTLTDGIEAPVPLYPPSKTASVDC